MKNKRCGNCMEYDDLSGFCSTHSSLVMATDSCDAWEVDVHTLLIDRTAELSELNLKFGKLQALADWVVNPPRNATAGSITRAQDVLRNYLYELEEEEYEK